MLLIFLIHFFPVPPKIIAKDDNPNIVVREGENMTLSCNATGHPKPHIVWRRENGDDIVLSNGKKGNLIKSSYKLPKCTTYSELQNFQWLMWKDLFLP